MDTFSYRVHLVNLSVSWLARCWLQGFLTRLYVSLLTISPKYFFASELRISRLLSGERGECKEWRKLSVARFACRFLDPRYIRYSPFLHPPRSLVPGYLREKEVTWSVRPGMPLLEFSGWLYSVCSYDLNTGIWGHPSDLFLTSSDPLSVGIWFHHSKRKITYALLLLLIHICKNLRLLPLGIGRYTRIISND